MVTEDARTEFSARLNEALDQCGIAPKGRGRQVAVAKLFDVSQKGARKWLEGEAIPNTKRIPEIAARLNTSTEWLLTGREFKSTPGTPVSMGLNAISNDTTRALVGAILECDRRNRLSPAIAEALRQLIAVLETERDAQGSGKRTAGE